MSNKLIFFVSACFLALISNAQTLVIDENFAATTLPVGWTSTGTVAVETYNSQRYVTLASGSTLTTIGVNKPVLLTFSHRASGNGKTLTVEKSVNDGEWTSIGTVSPSSGSSAGSASMNIGEAGSNNVKIRFSSAGTKMFIANIKVTASDIGDAPSEQAQISFGEITGSSVLVNITAGNGEGRLLCYKQNSAVDFQPAAGVSYQQGTNISGNVLVALGDVTSATIQGLEAGETYYFAVFEYNGFENSCIYLTPPATASTATLQVSSLRLSTYSIAFDRLKTGNTDKREFVVSGKYLSPAAGEIIIAGTSDFQISTDNLNYSDSVTVSYSDNMLLPTTVYVRFAPTELQEYAGEIIVSGGNSDSQTLQLSGVGSDTDNKIYYLSPSGNDNNLGTYDSPWFTLSKAISMVIPGDIVYVRGGEYLYPGMTFNIPVAKSGTANARIKVMAYNGELPIWNFDTAQGTSDGDSNKRGIAHKGDYWYFFGIHLTRARDNAVKLEGNHNIYERCTFSYNGDTGIQLGFGHSFQDSHPGISRNDGSHCSYNYIIDCDSYRNYDWQTQGGNADGFACKMHNGLQNWFIRCRAWENSDDGWDLYETDYPVFIIDCWAWRSAPAGILPARQGNGNGIKLGGNGTGGSSVGKHEAWNSVAFNCDKTGSVKGFDQNSHAGGVKVVNCLAFGCGYDFMFEKSSSVTMEFYNNVCFGRQEVSANHSASNNAVSTASTKGWASTNQITGIGASDYADLSEAAAMMPRGADGSMPTTFARLLPGSQLIGAAKPNQIAPLPSEITATDIVGSALNSRFAAGDIGPFDLNPSTGTQIIVNPQAHLSISAAPNPAKSETILKFAVEQSGTARITVFDIQGRQVATLPAIEVAHGVDYFIPYDVSNLSTGIYSIVLSADGTQTQSKIVVSR
ncbi:MAG: T9SS type A sorting domain-containing protein [Paludibacter sp.]|jgi:hypothetical protein|nr:T9SS type A sorting domain-containing protein [Paludibacter sp.]